MKARLADPVPRSSPERDRREERDVWIVRPRRLPAARVRLFAFPSAGRGPAMFRTWSDYLPAAVELCIVQLPGRETRWKETPLIDMGEVCQAIAEGIQPDLDRTCVFLGHSLGALVAFEVSRSLRRTRQITPRALVVAAHRAPHLPSQLARIAHLPDEEFLARLSDRYGGLSAAAMAQKELMGLVLPTLRADYGMAERYEYTDEEPLPCAISAFGGTDDRHVSDRELAAWGRQTSAAFVHRTMPGGHFFIDRLKGSLLSLMLDDLDTWGDLP